MIIRILVYSFVRVTLMQGGFVGIINNLIIRGKVFIGFMKIQKTKFVILYTYNTYH